MKHFICLEGIDTSQSVSILALKAVLRKLKRRVAWQSMRY